MQNQLVPFSRKKIVQGINKIENVKNFWGIISHDFKDFGSKISVLYSQRIIKTEDLSQAYVESENLQ